VGEETLERLATDGVQAHSMANASTVAIATSDLNKANSGRSWPNYTAGAAELGP
jgi:hypothetical protein